jgi:hypothetical protein
LGLALRAGFISMVTSFVAQDVLGGVTSNNGAASAGSPSGLGMGGLQSGVSESESLVQYAQTTLPGITVSSAQLPCASTLVGCTPAMAGSGASSSAAAAGISASRMIENTISLIPGVYFGNLATKHYQAGNYPLAGLATIGSVGDVAFSIYMGPFAIGARSGAATLWLNWQRHHPIPEFLGGKSIQYLHGLDQPVHAEFHMLLNQNLAEAGFPRTLVHGGSAADWAEYMVANPGSQELALGATLDAARVIDRVYGTSITQYTWRNLMYQRYTPIPRLGQ